MAREYFALSHDRDPLFSFSFAKSFWHGSLLVSTNLVFIRGTPQTENLVKDDCLHEII